MKLFDIIYSYEDNSYKMFKYKHMCKKKSKGIHLYTNNNKDY